MVLKFNRQLLIMAATNLLIFSLIFVGMNFLLDAASRKIRMDGIDFLFFAPWLAAIKFGIYPGIILAGIILFSHMVMHLRIARYILLSFPAQVIAVLFGYYFGISGFWVALVLYHLISGIITALLGGLGGRYFIFILLNIVTNVATFFAYRTLI